MLILMMVKKETTQRNDSIPQPRAISTGEMDILA